MLRTIFVCLAFFWATHVDADPTWAVVQLPSHGASATVIQTGPGRTLLLSCAHAFEGKDRYRPIDVDMPAPTSDGPRKVGVRLLAVDYRRDLSLIEVPAGPVPYVCPVAPRLSGSQVLSVGYDGMKKTPDGRPSVIKYATILETSDGVTWTREIPWHGRSGGALIDSNGLIGVVQGYETSGRRRGMYVSHQTILDFIADPSPLPRPAVQEYRYGPRQDCPNGQCPIRR